jgi:hypothetical protein
MSTSDRLLISPPDQIRKELALVVAEARALRQLLRLAEAAVRRHETRRRRVSPVQEGVAHDR